MKTSEFLNLLESNGEKGLAFILPDRREIKGDLHITEIKNVAIQSVDCGANEHFFNETIVQLWLDQRDLEKSQWTLNKAKKIVDVVADKMTFSPDSELFFEYGDFNVPTGKFSVAKAEEKDDIVRIHLFIKPTVCKPQLEGVSGCC